MTGAAPPVAAVVLGEAEVRLAAAGVATPRADAEWLLAGLLGCGRSALQLRLQEPLPAGVAAGYERAVARRCRREPLQQILGWEEFRGLRLRVTADVLVPRPETEVLVEAALGLLPAGRPRVVDVGTGSGCIACSLASERPDCRVVAVDRCPRALAVARANVDALGLAERVHLLCADLLGPVVSRGVDLVVANPPYLPSSLLPSLPPEVRSWEPRLALDGGPDGLAVLRRLVSEAGRVLKPGGGLAVETAGGDQARVVAGLLENRGFVQVVVVRDLTGTGRIVTGRLRAPVPAPDAHPDAEGLPAQARSASSWAGDPGRGAWPLAGA